MTSWGHFWGLRVHRSQPWEVGAEDPRGCGWAEGWLRHAQPVALSSLGKTGHSLKGHCIQCLLQAAWEQPETQVRSLRQGREERPGNKRVGGENLRLLRAAQPGEVKERRPGREVWEPTSGPAWHPGEWKPVWGFPPTGKLPRGGDS